MPRKRPSTAKHRARVTNSPPWTQERIRAHLLLAPPFMHCQEGHIRTDTKSSPLQEFPCRLWSLLVLALTDVLFDHFSKLSIVASLPTEAAQQTETALQLIKARIDIFFALQERKRLPPGAKRSVQERTMRKKFQEIADVVQSLPPADNVGKALLERALYPRFCYELHVAFRTYGPDIGETTFSREARYRACAAILLHFNLTTGCLSTIADTFGRYVRHVTPRPK